MDSVWTQLPLELAEYICNKLPSVRSVNHNLIQDIKNQRHLLYKVMRMYKELHGSMGLTFLAMDMDATTETIIHSWDSLPSDQRNELYKELSYNIDNVIDCAEDYREAYHDWLENEREYYYD